jgi:hypothetical protein
MEAMKNAAAVRVIEQLPLHAHELAGYADRAGDVQGLGVRANEHDERRTVRGLLRPILKADEWLVVVLRAALGFAFGDLQLHLLLS